MIITEQSNWLSFNIFFPPKTLLGEIPKNNKCYFEFLKDNLKPFIESKMEEIKYLFFSHYITQKPIDKIIIDKFNTEDWFNELHKLPANIVSQLGNNMRYVRLRFYINRNREIIITEFKNLLDNLDSILGYQLVEYDVSSDLGKRYSNHSDILDESIEIRRLTLFIEYWNAICRYILSIITDDYFLDFKNVDITGILHLGFNSLGNHLPLNFQKCERCGGVIYLLSNREVSCNFKCNCGVNRGNIPFL